MRSTRITLMCLVFTVAASSVPAQGVPDFLLYGFHGAKLGLALGRWRTVAFVTDLSVSLAGAGWGVWRFATETGVTDQIAGFSAIMVGVAGAALSMIDLVPFAVER